MLLQILQDLLLLLDLATVVLRLLPRDRDLKLIILEFLLLSLDLHTQLKVLLLQSHLLLLGLLVHGLVHIPHLLKHTPAYTATPVIARQLRYQLLTLLREHLQLQLLLLLLAHPLSLIGDELRHMNIVVHIIIILFKPPKKHPL